MISLTQFNDVDNIHALHNPIDNNQNETAVAVPRDIYGSYSLDKALQLEAVLHKALPGVPNIVDKATHSPRSRT
ncbi:MAG: hypothetical protein ACXV7J_07680 [Methylomonas sp.]